MALQMKKCLFLILFCVTLLACDEDLTVARDIKGIWRWQNTCGGIVGCQYAGDDSKKTLIITADRVILKEDASHAEIYAYEILTTTEGETTSRWEIKLSDGSIILASVEKEKAQLSIEQNSVLVSTYKRIR
jgi:hypothetical protein